MAEEGKSSSANLAIRTVFISTNLDTHLAMNVSDADTVGLLKQKVAIEHSLCFPNIGDIKILAMKVRRKSHLYHLSDSMLVKSAFDGHNGTWFLHMDAGPMAVVKHDKFTVVDFSNTSNCEHADEPASLLGHSHVPNNEVPLQKVSHQLEYHTVLCNDKKNLNSFDNQQSPTWGKKEMLSQLCQGLDHSDLEETRSLPSKRTSDVVAAKLHVSEIDILPQDIDEERNIVADDMKTVSALDSAKKDAPKRSRAVKVGKGLGGVTQKSQKEVTKDVSSANQSERSIMENHVNAGNDSEEMLDTESTKLENLSRNESKRTGSTSKRLTKRPQEEMASEDLNSEKKKRKKKKSNPLSKVDSGLLSETENGNINGSAIVRIPNHDGCEESSGREFVQENFVKSIDSVDRNYSKDSNNDAIQNENVISTNDPLWRGRQEDPTNLEEVAADSLPCVSRSRQDNVNVKETVSKEEVEDFTRELETEGEVLKEEVTVRDEGNRQTKTCLPATEKSVHKHLVSEAKNVFVNPSVHEESAFSDKISDAEITMGTKVQTRSNRRRRGLDGAQKNIQDGNAAVQAPESNEVTLTELLNDKEKKNSKSKKSRKSFENHASSVTEEVYKESDVGRSVECNVDEDKELRKGNNMHENEENNGSINLVNSLKVFQNITPKGTTSDLFQTQAQDGHDGLKVLEAVKNTDTLVLEKRRKNSRLRKKGVGMTEVKQKSDHKSSFERTHQVVEDKVPTVGDSSNEKQVDLLSDELIVPAKKAKDNALEEKQLGLCGDQIGIEDGNGASRVMEHFEVIESEALGDKYRTKSESKKSRTDVEIHVWTGKKVDNSKILEGSQNGDLLLDGGITQAEKPKTLKASSLNVKNAEKVYIGSKLVGDLRYMENLELNASRQRRKSKKSQMHAEKDILVRNVSSNQTDVSGKEAHYSSKNMEGTETQKIESYNHLQALTGKNCIHSSEAEKDEPTKKRKSRSEKVKYDLTESRMDQKKDSYLEPDAATKTSVLGDVDKGTQQAENDKSDMLDIYLPKAAQPVEHGGVVKHKKAVPRRLKASRAKNPSPKEIYASSDNTEDLEGTVFISYHHEQTPPHTNAYCLAPKKPHDKVLGTIVNHSNQKKSLLTESDSIFQHSESESSLNAGEVKNSDSTSDGPSDNSSTYSGQDGTPKSKKLPSIGSPGTGSTAHSTHDGKSNTTNGGGIHLSQSVTAKTPLGTILRNSSSYRKAKITASQALLESTDSELPDSVPDSQAAAAAFPVSLS